MGCMRATRVRLLSSSRDQVGGGVSEASEGASPEAEALGVKREFARCEVCGLALVVVETLWGSGLSPPQGGWAEKVS